MKKWYFLSFLYKDSVGGFIQREIKFLIIQNINARTTSGLQKYVMRNVMGIQHPVWLAWLVNKERVWLVMTPERNVREMNEKFWYANMPESIHLGSLDLV